MSMIFLILIIVLKIVFAQKCSYIYDDKNAVKTVQCVNVMSMVDIADEIRSNWTSIAIINRASHPQFTNNAVNVPYLNVIQHLDLSRVGKLALSDTGFRDYDSLKSLHICNTEIAVLKSSWFSRKTLEVLNISENLLKALKKEDMKFFAQLKSFNASFNEIKTLEPNTFLESKKLETISLNNNQLVNVAFENLDNLKHLYIKDNMIVTIWAVTFHKMPRLETLNIASNEITGIVDRSFSTLENLKYLNLSYNKVPYIGPWLFAGAAKIKLAELDLSFNLITIIYPICFHELPLLTFLDLSNNKITEIFDKNFFKSISLQTLIISDNRIGKIAPKSFEKLLALKTMDLSDNKLETFTIELFGGNSFAGNKLKKLSLSNNLLTTLKGNLFAILINLSILDLTGNKFTTFPPDLLKANINLQKIQLDNNQIEDLPIGFFDSLKALQELSILNNKISFLPTLTNAKRLQQITIGQNPWQCTCLREIIIYARSNNVKLDNSNFNSPFPSCVAIPDTTCIKVPDLLAPHQVFDKYSDGVSTVETEIGQKRSEF